MNYFDNDSDDDDFSEEEYNKKRNAAKNHPLRIQADEILNVLKSLIECIEDEDEREMHGGTLMESAYIINAKLSGAIGSDSYLVCMQNASIIRDHAEYIRLSNHSLNAIHNIDKKYVSILREEMEKFRSLFKEWGREIHNMKESDEFNEDEWGLF